MKTWENALEINVNAWKADRNTEETGGSIDLAKCYLIDEDRSGSIMIRVERPDVRSMLEDAIFGYLIRYARKIRIEDEIVEINESITKSAFELCADLTKKIMKKAIIETDEASVIFDDLRISNDLEYWRPVTIDIINLY